MHRRGAAFVWMVAGALLSACGGGGSSGTQTALPRTPQVQPSPTPGPRMSFIGDSWFAGVGVATSCYPRPTMSSAPCPNGESIPDTIARMMGASAYQNLAQGGSYLYDANHYQAPNVDPSAQVVLVMSGYNDEKPMGDAETDWDIWNACNPSTRTYWPDAKGNSFCPVPEPYTFSIWTPKPGFPETPLDPLPRVTSIVQEIRARAPHAQIFLVWPAHLYRIPQFDWTIAQDLAYHWSTNIIDAAIAAQPVATVDLGDAPIYNSANFVPQGSARHPTSEIAPAIRTARACPLSHGISCREFKPRRYRIRTLLPAPACHASRALRE